MTGGGRLGKNRGDGSTTPIFVISQRTARMFGTSDGGDGGHGGSVTCSRIGLYPTSKQQSHHDRQSPQNRTRTKVRSRDQMRATRVLLFPFRKLGWKSDSYKNKPEMKEKVEKKCQKYFDDNKTAFKKRGITDGMIRDGQGSPVLTVVALFIPLGLIRIFMLLWRCMMRREILLQSTMFLLKRMSRRPNSFSAGI